jgi:hypothetical protein
MKDNEFVRHVARMREMRKTYKVLVASPECKKPLGRPNC